MGSSSIEEWESIVKWDILKDILPNQRAADKALVELILEGRMNASIDEEEVIVPKSVQKEENKLPEEERTEFKSRFDLRLSVEEEKRLRFRAWNYTNKKIPNTDVEFARFGPRWGRGLSLAYTVCPQEYKWQVYIVMKNLKVWEQKTEKGLRGTLKSLSDVAKKQGDLLFPGYWKLLVNWENLGGYLEIPEMSTFKPDIVEWVTGDIMHKMPNPNTNQMDELYFLNTLEDGMLDFLEKGPNVEGARNKAMTIEEYAADPTIWMSAGSSMSNFANHNEAVYALDVRTGKYKKAKKTKSRTGLAISSEEVERILRTKDPAELAQFNVAIPKAEPGKVRAVVNSALEMFLRMDYISQFLETALKGHPETTLYYDETQMYDMWTNMGLQARDPSTTKIPLDQSHFDWQQNMRMIERFCVVVTKYISHNMYSGQVKDDLLLVMDSISQGMYQLPGVVEIDGESLLVGKGVLSGWRWTALIDTVFNLGEIHCARVLISDIGHGTPSEVIELIGQGDDDKVLTTSAGLAAALTVAYLIMDFEINPGKFFVDNKRDEYLRQVSTPTEVAGYLIRGINTILWRNPGSSDPPAGLLRASDQMKSWAKLISRGGDVEEIERLMINDISNGNGLSAQDVKDLLCTPVTVGGLGYHLNRPATRWLSFKPGETKYDTLLKTAGMKGIRKELDIWKNEYGRTFTTKEKSEALIDRLDVSSFAKREVIEGKVEEVPLKRYSRMTWEEDWFYSNYTELPPLSARARKEYPKLMGDYVLHEELEKKDALVWVNAYWIDLSLVEISSRIHSRGGKQLWKRWILAKLPFKTPVVPGWREETVSLMYKRVITRFWARLYRRSSYNMNDIIGIALRAEDIVYNNIDSLPVRLGG